MSSTAAATLRQLVVFVVDRVIEEDRRMLLTNELKSITLPTQAFRFRRVRHVLYLRGLCLSVRRASANPTARVPPQDGSFRADQERTHEIPRTLPQGVSLLLFTHPRPIYRQLSSNYYQVHNIPGSYYYHNTTSSPSSSKRSPSAPLSRFHPQHRIVFLRSSTVILLRARDGGPHYSSNSLLARLTPVSPGLGG